MSEFNFISQNEDYTEIYKLCVNAETASKPDEKALYCRDALEVVIKYIYKKECKKYPKDATMLEIINSNLISRFVDNAILLESLHFIRKLGMKAKYGEHIKKTHAKLAVDNLIFFVHFIVRKYTEPDKMDEIVLPKYMTEALTRDIYIDHYLKEAGWEVIPPNSKTTLPSGVQIDSGTVFPSKACCEIPVHGMNNDSGIGFCDYVLYGRDGKPLAIVEAKNASEKPEKGSQQVKVYGECMKAEYGYIPILYYTNGYEIFVIDGIYPSRKIMAFHSIDELEYMLQNRKRNDISDFVVRDDIAGRPYQKMAITSVCERFNAMFRRSLLVMATGTGKTRVSIALVELLLRNKWIKNVLFLADRTSLVEQAFINFKKILPDTSYCVLSDKKLANEPNARITFSTHQTMIGYIDAEAKEFTCGRYDLIIIDEAHRSIFNKYGTIFECFDALLVGLTATPKDEVDANTYQLFNCESGEPNFVYSLEEAVKDDYLVPYRVESKTTKLLSQGIKYGDLSEEDKQNVESVLENDEINDDFVIPKEKIFKLFYNKNTCNRVLDDLMNNALMIDDGQNIGKTIIFAYNHRHAKLIVDTFKENYPKLGENYCQLIDNQVKGADDLILKFGSDDNFRIAVSVDMLDTGIDVPSVLNLVFFKPIKSKIKFVQMIGRGTRLCEGLIDGQDKEFFLIFDYCSNFEFFNINPQGMSITNGKSLSQKLYDIKLDIMVELQSYEHQCNEIHRAYYLKLKKELFEKTQDIKRNASRISVRKEMSYVDKYMDADRWDAIAPLAKKEIQLHLSKLIDNDLEEDKMALRFDMQMLQIELSTLVSGNVGHASKQVERVRKIANTLLQYAASQPAVIDKAESLLLMKGTEFWNAPKVDKLEKCREDIRTLLMYLPPTAKPVDIDAMDIVIDVENNVDFLIDIRTYKEKVLDYLAKHTENTTIHKIQNLEQIDIDDLHELERILWHELGTQEEYHKITDIENLAAFIRSIVGVEQNAINEKFGQFLNENVLNSQQQEFVKAIIDYVRENGDICTEDLIEKSPFDSYDIVSLFGSNITIITSIVNQIHGSIMAA